MTYHADFQLFRYGIRLDLTSVLRVRLSLLFIITGHHYLQILLTNVTNIIIPSRRVSQKVRYPLCPNVTYAKECHGNLVSETLSKLIYFEEVGRIFLRKLGIYLPDSTTSHVSRDYPQRKCCVIHTVRFLTVVIST